MLNKNTDCEKIKLNLKKPLLVFIFVNILGEYEIFWSEFNLKVTFLLIFFIPCEAFVHNKESN